MPCSIYFKFTPFFQKKMFHIGGYNFLNLTDFPDLVPRVL